MTLPTIDYSRLNPGIRKTVQLLREAGFNTVDSGDGKTGDFECDLPIPYVHMRALPMDVVQVADKLRSLLVTMGVDFSEPYSEEGEGLSPHIEAHYTPEDKLATISLLNVDDQALGL